MADLDDESQNRNTLITAERFSEKTQFSRALLPVMQYINTRATYYTAKIQQKKLNVKQFFLVYQLNCFNGRLDTWLWIKSRGYRYPGRDYDFPVGLEKII